MENINEVVAYNLYKYRKAKNLSLEKISKLTNVSKTVLNKIEKGEGNPTINTLVNLANGIQIPISNLITKKESSIQFIDNKYINPIHSIDKTVTVCPYFPYDKNKNFEMFSMNFEMDGFLYSKGHEENSREFIIVNKGILKIKVGKHVSIVKEKQAISFESDSEHSYFNIGEGVLELTATIQY
ncbi:XRE family transcriptional regulator (plasmid) [Staphylococcus sp. IVB6181]|uniref:helix-turn-helix domain-containing protein n=1 Tax=Staphylococcus sp. IVB6181 TaxID=2929481 RepID=UPI0021D19FE1|nr:XRE family transcriptional regulator [Staphylococcus sp. IVB6181]UXV36286.1 XRE family transcriptional regulator [Staphylococcus sp. IVB6181]